MTASSAEGIAVEPDSYSGRPYCGADCTHVRVRSLGSTRQHRAAGPRFRFLLSVPDRQAPLLHGMSQGSRLSRLGALSCPGFQSSLPASLGQAGRWHASLLLRSFWPELSHMAPSNRQGLQNVVQLSAQEEQGGCTSSYSQTHECILSFNP